MNFTSNVNKIANSNRPFAVVVAYQISVYPQGEVLSQHKSHELAEAAMNASLLARNGWCKIMDAREYAEPLKKGRPAELKDGRAINVYLDAESISAAEALGNGSISAGIRAALADK